MGRDFQIEGDTLVKVIFGAHASGQTGTLSSDYVAGKLYHQTGELGLNTAPINVSLRGNNEPIRINSYGSRVPVDVMTDFVEAEINMQLIHFNPSLLELCWNESMGGAVTDNIGSIGGALPPGTLLGGGRVLQASGCHFMGLVLWPTAIQERFVRDFNLAGGMATQTIVNFLRSLGVAGSTPEDYARQLVGSGAWTFWATHLTMEPVTYPLSTKTTVVNLTWHAIVYPHYTVPLSSGTSWIRTSERAVPYIPSPAASIFSGGSIPLLSRYIPETIMNRDALVYVP